jgi:hypothetical protein
MPASAPHDSLHRHAGESKIQAFSSRSKLRGFVSPDTPKVDHSVVDFQINLVEMPSAGLVQSQAKVLNGDQNRGISTRTGVAAGQPCGAH